MNLNLREIIRSRGMRSFIASGTVATMAEACGESTPNPAVSSVQGTWTGTVGQGSDKVAIRFSITDDSGTLGGGGSFGDPNTSAFWPFASSLTGNRIDDRGSWTTAAGLQVTGTFTGQSFSGKVQFPADGTGASPLTADIQMTWHQLEPSPTPPVAAASPAARAALFLAPTNGIGQMMPLRPCSSPRPSSDRPL